MDVNKLLERLHGNDPLEALSEFSKELQSKDCAKELVIRFHEVSPNFDCILRLLNRLKNTKSELATIFEALECILTSLSDDPTYMSVSLHITRWVLQNHSLHLTSLLSPSSTSRINVIVIQFITSMVISGILPAREILTELNFGSVNFELLACKRDEFKEKDVRTSLFLLILAFLNIKNDRCLELFLGTPGFLSSIFEGLSEDPFELVDKLLNLLRDVIVLNENFPKSSKVKLFNAPNCKSLFKLFFRSEKVKTNFIPEEKEKIKASLNTILVPLSSSNKIGIVFKEKENSLLKHFNPLAFLVIKNLDYPWDFKEGRELICSILISCPPAYEVFLDTYKYLAEPRESEGYFSMLQLYMSIIEKKSSLSIVEIMLKKEKRKYISTVFPFIVGTTFQSIILNRSLILKNFGLLLLACLFSKVLEIIQLVDKTNSIDVLQKNILKRVLLKELEDLTMGPNMIVKQYYSILEIEDEFVTSKCVKSVCFSKASLLAKVCELLYIYLELYGYDHMIKRGCNLPAMLNKSKNICKEKDMRNDSDYQNMMIYVLKMLLMLQKNGSFEAFGFSETTFKNEDSVGINEDLFVNLVRIYCYYNLNTENVDHNLAGELRRISSLLLNSSIDYWGLSSYCESHLELWLNKIKSSEIEKCSQFFAKVASKSVSNLFYYLNMLLANVKNQDTPRSNQINLIETINQLNPAEEVGDSDIVKINEIRIPFSILVPAAQDTLKANPDAILIKYFSSIIEDYMHLVINPEPLCVYLLETDQHLDLGMKVYMKSWIESEPQDEKNLLFVKNGPTSSLKELFIKGNVLSASNFCIKLKSEIINITEFSIVCKQLFLYAQNELQKHSCNKKRLKFFFKVLKNLLKSSEENSKQDQFNDIYKYLIKHPFTLSNFTPFSPSTVAQNEVDNIILTVIKDYPSLHHHVKAFYYKSVRTLNSSTVNESTLLSPTLMDLLDINCLTYNDIENMINPILSSITLPTSEININVLNKLFEILIDHSSITHHPSENISSLCARKIIKFSSQEEFSRQELYFLKKLSHALSFSMKSVMQTMNEEELKKLITCKAYDVNLCTSIIEAKPSLTEALAKKLLKKKELNLKDHSSLIALLLEVLKSNKYIESSLPNIKVLLLELFPSSGNQWNDHYGNILSYLLQNGLFERSEVHEICNQLYEKVVKEKTVVPLHLTFFIPLFDHLKNNNKDIGQKKLYPYLQLLSILMFLVTKMYKKVEDPSDINAAVDHITFLIKELKSSSINEEFYNNKLWFSFFKQVLRYGLTDLKSGPKLLQCVINLTTKIYAKEHKKKDENDIASIKNLYQMLRSHSNFISIMINQEKELEVIKEQVVSLQLAFIECNTKVCEERHVPLLLGSYGATSSKSDQIILKLLYLYEASGAMPNIEPILWGHRAVTHFAVEKGPGVDIEYRTPKHLQSLSLLDYEKVIETALNFNMELELNPGTIICGHPALYDQRFLLTLFMQLSSEPLQQPLFKYLEKGILAMGIAALSSHQEEVWSVGAGILRNIVDHFQDSRLQNLKHQWMWLIGVIGYGLNNKPARISSIIVHFLVHASHLLMNPSDIMYKPVMNYLYLNPAFPLDKVPEFYVFVFSDDICNRDYRTFILRLLSSGIRDESDYNICQMHYIPKIILAMVTSNTVNMTLRVLGLNVLKAMVNTKKGAQSLVLEHSLLGELPLAINTNFFCSSHALSHWIDSVIEILTCLWNTWTVNSMLLKEKIDSLQNESEISISKKRKNVDDTTENPNKWRKVPNGKVVTNKTCSENEDDSTINANKSRKLANGKYVTDGFKNFVYKKYKKNSKVIGGVSEFTACLASILHNIISNGNTNAISQCLNLLHKIIIYYEKLEKMAFIELSLPNKYFIKKQVKSWIDTSDLHKRLQDYLTEEENVLLGFIKVSDDRRNLEPLPRNRCKDEKSLEDENNFLVSETKKLFQLLNS